MKKNYLFRSEKTRVNPLDFADGCSLGHILPSQRKGTSHEIVDDVLVVSCLHEVDVSLILQGVVRHWWQVARYLRHDLRLLGFALNRRARAPLAFIF